MIPLVTIIIDMAGLLRTQETNHVTDAITDYPGVYLAIKEAIQYRRTLSVHVRNRTVASWLTQCAHMYGETLVALCTYTPRDALAQQWQISIPDRVSDQDILQSGLLDAHVIPREGQDFWNVLLEHFYGSEFAYAVFPSGSLDTLLNNFHTTQWQKAVGRPLVIQAQRSRLAQWLRSANSEAMRAIVERLAEEPDALRRDLIAYKVLQHYPQELGVKVLGGTWDIFHQVHLNLDGLVFALQEASEAIREIEYYLSAQREQMVSSEPLQTVLSQMSGYLYTEFDYVETLIQQHPEFLTPALYQKIEQHFHPLKHTLDHSLIKLQRMLRPAFPKQPDQSWSIAEWLDWIINFYMPYYAWLDTQAQQDSTLASYACMFADWLYDHFIYLKHSSSQYFSFSALYRERARMIANDTVTLILLVDNLNFTYFETLKQQFQQQNFLLEDVEPLLSLIPTATEVGKAALIAGTGDQTDFLDNRYPDLVSKAWSSLLQGKKVKYLQNIGELQQERSLTHDVYFLNYLPIDEALHEDNRNSGLLHADIIHRYLSSLVKEVVQFAKRCQIESRLLVYVISDHGSTRIPQETVNVIDQKFFKRLALKSHHRFVRLSDDMLASLPQMVDAQCYLIDRQRFKTNHSYLVAKQYYRFIRTQANFYVHGGLMPEEVVVPFALFTHQPIVPEAPSLRLLTKELRYSIKSKIEIEVGNPNAFPLEALNLSLIDLDADEIFLPSLAAKRVTPVTFTTIIRKRPDSTRTRAFTLRVRYQCYGRQFVVPDQTFEVMMKSLMEVDDDDFDF